MSLPIPAGAGSAATIGISLGLDQSLFEAGLFSASDTLDRWNQKMNDVFRKASITVLGFSGTISAALAVAARSGVQFEGAMRNVQSVMHFTDAEFKNMSRDVLEVGQKTNQSATEMAQALYNIGSAGFSGAEGIEVLRASATAAAAGLSTVGEASNAITASLSAYGLQARHAADVSDILFKAVEIGQFTFGDLAESMNNFLGIASSAKVPLDQAAAAVAVISRTTNDAAESSTQLGRFIQQLIQPSQALTAAFQQQFQMTTQASLANDGFSTTVQRVIQLTHGSAQAMVQFFPDIRAASGAMALAAGGGQSFTDALGQMDDKMNRVGATQRAFNTQQKATQEQLKAFTNAVQRLVISGVTPLVQALGSVAHAGTVVATTLDKIPGPVKEGTVVMLALTAAFSALLGVSLLLVPIIVRGLVYSLIKAAVTSDQVRGSVRLLTAEFLRLAAAAGVSETTLNSLNFSSLAGSVGNTVRQFSILRTAQTAIMTAFKAGLFISVAIVALDALGQRIEKVSDKMRDLGNMSNDEIKKKLADALGEARKQTALYGDIPVVSHLPSQVKTVVETFANVIHLGREAKESDIKSSGQLRYEYNLLADQMRKIAQEQGPEMAKRLIEQAQASGATKNEIAGLKAGLAQYNDGQKDAAAATADATAEIRSQSGVMRTLSEDAATAVQNFQDMAEAMRQAFGGIFDSPFQDQVDAQQNLEDATKDVAKAQRDYDRLKKESSQKGVDGTNQEIDAQQRLADATRKAKEEEALLPFQKESAAAEVESAKAEVADAKKDLEELIAAAGSPDDIREAKKRLADANERQARAEQRVQELAQADPWKQVREATDNLTTARQKASDMTDRLTDAEDRLDAARRKQKEAQDKVNVSTDELFKNLQDQVQAVDDWGNNLATIGQSAPEDFVDYLRQLGPKAAPQVAALAKLSKPELEKYVKLWRQQTYLVDQQVAFHLAYINKLTPEQLSELIRVSGLSLDQLVEVWKTKGGDAARQFIQAIKDEFQKFAGTHPGGLVGFFNNVLGLTDQKGNPIGTTVGNVAVGAVFPGAITVTPNSTAPTAPAPTSAPPSQGITATGPTGAPNASDYGVGRPLTGSGDQPWAPYVADPTWNVAYFDPGNGSPYGLVQIISALYGGVVGEYIKSQSGSWDWYGSSPPPQPETKPPNVLHSGGMVMHDGGLAADEVPAILQRGEFVIRRSAVNALGTDYLHAINRYHDGGVVRPPIASGAAGPTQITHVTHSFGPITVVANDAQKMIESLQRKERIAKMAGGV